MSNKFVQKVAIVTFLAMLTLMILVSSTAQSYGPQFEGPRIAAKPTE
jgi:hypothetical protein